METLSIFEKLLMIVWGLGFLAMVVCFRKPAFARAIALVVVGYVASILVWIVFGLILTRISHPMPAAAEAVPVFILLGNMLSGILLLFRGATRTCSSE